MEEVYDLERDSQLQTRRSGRGKGRTLEDIQPEEVDIRDKKTRGREEDDCMGSPSSAIGHGSRVREGNGGGAGRGRSRPGRGGRCQAGNQERTRPQLVGIKRGRRTMKRQVQYTERVYSKDTHVDIRRII